MANKLNNLNYFEKLAHRATAGISNFAAFASASEYLFAEDMDSATLEIYSAAWFELEIVNACALDDWDMDGRPVVWDEQWRDKYQALADEVLQNLVDTVRSIAI